MFYYQISKMYEFYGDVIILSEDVVAILKDYVL